MTERIRIEVEDAELDAVIAKMDEAILKKAELLGVRVPRETEDITKVTAVAEDEVHTVIANLESQLDDVQAEAIFVEGFNEAIIDKAVVKILATEEAVRATEAFAELTIQKIMAELSGVQTYAHTVRKLIELDLEGIRIEGEATVVKMGKIQDFAKELPQVDRATRMLLLRIPGLREVLRLIYIIKMEERTMRLGGIRGPVTAIITAVIYMTILLKSIENRQAKTEARLEELEKREEMRFITIEEAIRGYGNLPERYRSMVPP